MERIIIPRTLTTKKEVITKEQIEGSLIAAGKAPSIKEQLILKAYEITDKTELLYNTLEVALLYSSDATGIYLSCFNKLEVNLSVELPLSAMNLDGKYAAYCVLTGEEISVLDNKLNLEIPDRGVLLVKILEV